MVVQRRHFVHEPRDDGDQSVQSARAAAAPWHDSECAPLRQTLRAVNVCRQFVITANEAA